MDRREHGRDVSRWKDGEVPPGEAARIESHLAECEECRRAADVIDAVRSHIGGWPEPDAPADLPSRVRSRIHAQAARILSMKTHLRLTAAAASVLFVASLAVYPLVGAPRAPAAATPESITDVALDEMMIELAADYRPALAGEEDER